MITDASNYLSIVFAALAAVYWFRASRAEVAPTPEEDPRGICTTIGRNIVTSVGNRRVNVGKTMVKQTSLNSWGAGFACAASACQAVSLLATKLQWP